MLTAGTKGRPVRRLGDQSRRGIMVAWTTAVAVAVERSRWVLVIIQK